MNSPFPKNREQHPPKPYSPSPSSNMTASTSTSIKAIYNQRSPTYDTSSTSPFHIRQARDYIHLAALQPSFSVLDLACGTGLVTILAKQSVGPTGTVIGVDFSEGMLDVARRKTRESGLEITFYEHDITDLSELELGKADVVTCASALLLMPDPLVAVTHRATMLKTGGGLLTDVVNERDVIANASLRKVGPEVGRSLGWDGGWVESEGSLRRLFIDAGLEVEEV